MSTNINIAFFIFSLLYLSCNGDDIDTSPPSVFLTNPTEFSTVSQEFLVTGNASDNDSIKFVELYIDTLSSGIIDTIPPYEFLWNTTVFLDSSIHAISLYAEDINENGTKSIPIEVLIDNSNSNPQGVTIQSIEYSEINMEILFKGSKEIDFSNYELLSSDTENGLKTSLSLKSEINDTIFNITNFNPTIPTWYFIKVTDLYGYSTTGPGYYVIDSPPQPVLLMPISFDGDSFDISWSINDEKDFFSYSIFQSSNQDMENEVKIYEYDQPNINEYNLQEIPLNQYLYYQIEIADFWGLKSRSNIEKGTSWFLFENQYGAANHNFGRSIIELSDGGYVCAGNSSTSGNEFGDLLLIKIDKSGGEQWIHNLSFSPSDRANMLIESSDSGIIIVGNTVSIINGSKDILILKTNQSGHVEWHNNYGNDEDQEAHYIHLLNDNSYIICGQSVEQNTGFNELLLMKVDLDGTEVWSKTYGGNGDDFGYSIIEENDGSILVTGMTKSFGDLNGDAWLLKIDINGNEVWNKTYGGSGIDLSRHFISTSDGYIMIGNTTSYGSGNNDIFLIKVDLEGNQQWSNTFGGIGTDIGRKIINCNNNGFALIGYTDSYGEGNSFNNWLIKIDELGNLIWDKTFGGDGNDRALSGIKTSDNGFILSGFSDSNSSDLPNVFIVKTDENGNIK